MSSSNFQLSNASTSDLGRVTVRHTELLFTRKAMEACGECVRCDVYCYLYSVTFSGKDMRGDWRVRRSKRDSGFFWLPRLPQVVLRQLVHMLSYK